MGFYAPAQIVGDARKNGVEIREIDVSFSHAQNTLEEKCGNYHAVRLGFRQIDGFRWNDPDEERLKKIQSSFRGTRSVNPESRDSPMCNCTSGFVAAATPRNDDGGAEDWAERIVAARQRRSFTSLEDFARDTGLPKRALILLADADAFHSIGLDRRAALWAVRRVPPAAPPPPCWGSPPPRAPGANAKTTPPLAPPRQGGARYHTAPRSRCGDTQAVF